MINFPASPKADLEKALGQLSVSPAPAAVEQRSAFISAAIVLLAVAACLGAFLIEGNKGLNLMDEGFLWYGCQRVLHGELPLRDFFSYDPLRYFWTAGIMGLWQNHGIMAVRTATMLFGTGGIVAAALMINGTTRRWARALPITAISVCLLLLWLVPRHKLFDIATSIALVAALAFMLKRRDARSFFVAGVAAGLAAFLGRNHGVYGVGGLLLALPLLFISGERIAWRRCLPSWLAGVTSGYLPMLIMLALVPGFFQGLRDSVLFTVQAAPTLSMPVPWPWKLVAATPFEPQQFAVGCFYVLLIAFDSIGAVWLAVRAIRRKPLPDPIIAGAILMSIVYSHHALFYPGIAHLAQSVFPMLIGLSAILMRSKLPAPAVVGALAMLMAGSAVAALPYHPAYNAWHAHWTRCAAGSDQLVVDRSTAQEVKVILAAIDRYSADGRFVMLPYWPTVYAMREQRSPLYDIYATFDRPESYQKTEIAALQDFDASVVLLLDKPPDSQYTWLYARTHPLVAGYLADHWKKLPPLDGQPQLSIYVKRQ